MDLFFVHQAYAAENLDQFIVNVDTYIINPLIILLFAVAVVYFLWGVFQFLSNPDNEEMKTNGKQHMMYGILGITIMMAVWTLLSIILNTLEISDSDINPKQGTVHLQDYTPSDPQGFFK